MKSIGEAMAIGRTFKEALLKAIASLDPLSCRFFKQNLSLENLSLEWIRKQLITPHPERLWILFHAFRHQISIDEVHKVTGYDPWFLFQIQDLVAEEQVIKQCLRARDKNKIKKKQLFSWKQNGFSDKHLPYLLGYSEKQLRELRWKMGLHPVYKRIDTCAAEFPNETAYMYSTYEEECESKPTSNKKIVILGSGPNRIGQGIEFDYCCVHAVKAIKDLNYEAIIINCNPETVSTDYDVADRLYIEPLSAEYVLEILRIENPIGTILQMGGQTPLNLGQHLSRDGWRILGTPSESIELAEDRDKFRLFAHRIGLIQPNNGAFSSDDEAFYLANKIGYPVIVRPSFVISGSGIQILSNEKELNSYLSGICRDDLGPFLIEEFLENCLEVEVDAICDGVEVFCCGIVEHLDPTGIHSGDSISFLFPYKLTQELQFQILEETKKIGIALGIIGLFNVQFAVRNNVLVILEVNPRASRTVPLLSKTTGLPLVQIATKCILGRSLQDQKLLGPAKVGWLAMKMPVFPFSRLFIENETLGPQMKSTGEILCVSKTLEELFMKASIYNANSKLFPKSNKDKLPPPDSSIPWEVYQVNETETCSEKLALSTHSTSRVEFGLSQSPGLQ